jgi:hypothetical protein
MGASASPTVAGTSGGSPAFVSASATASFMGSRRKGSSKVKGRSLLQAAWWVGMASRSAASTPRSSASVRPSSVS